MSSKISDLLNTDNVTFSFEITPAVSKKDIELLKEEPLFYSVTWHAKGHGCVDLDIPPLKIARFLKDQHKEVLLHLSCDQLKTRFLESLLTHLREQGLCNLFVILGESYDRTGSDFKNSQELIKFIRDTTGQYFCIGVAGYPDDEEKFVQLKEKVHAGADFIITQAFFDLHSFEKFEQKLKTNGIEIPIIPGVFIFKNSHQLRTFSDLCRVKLSESILQHIGHNDMAGFEIVKKLINDITEKNKCANFHIFTLNKLKETTEFLLSI